MAFRISAKKTVQVEPREVSQTGIFFANTEANRRNSMALLKRNGLRPLTYQEAIVMLDQNPKLKEQLKKTWFYLDGKGSQVPSGYYTFNEKGELTQGKGDIEKTVCVYKGSQPLSLDVLANDNARRSEGRYVLDADNSPDDAALVVVGGRAGHEVVTPEIEVSPTEEGVKLAGVTTKQLITLQRDSAQELFKVAEAFGSESLPKTRMLVEALRIKE